MCDSVISWAILTIAAFCGIFSLLRRIVQEEERLKKEYESEGWDS